MKKVIAMGLMALAISVSANAKTVSKVKSSTKAKHHLKTNIVLFSCFGGQTSCGVSYMFCDNSKDFPTADQQLATWQAFETYYCG